MEVTHEYASKAATNTAVTLGAIGTGLGVLNSNNNGNGLLGGLLGGGNNNQMMALMSENATLKSEKYTDAQVAELYRAKVRDDKELAVFASNIDKRVSALETAAPLREQILDGKIALVAQQSTCCCNAATTAIAGLQSAMDKITKLVVPNSSVCPGWGTVTVAPATTPTTAG
jgi:hypothetical protein